MKRILHLLIVIAIVTIALAPIVFADDGYVLGSGTYPAETNDDPVPVTPPAVYEMPAVPYSKTVASSSVFSIPQEVETLEASFVVIRADDNLYLNGSVETPTDGILIPKDTVITLPFGTTMNLVTSTDTVALKLLPID